VGEAISVLLRAGRHLGACGRAGVLIALLLRLRAEHRAALFGIQEAAMFGLPERDRYGAV
jgi:hypothetical protein